MCVIKKINTLSGFVTATIIATSTKNPILAFKNNFMRKLSSTNYYNQTYLEEKCALNELLHLLSKRWLTDVLFSIEEGNTRFSSIKEDLKHISDNILADRLKHLEHYKLIRRRNNIHEVPQCVEYSLTESGTKLSDMLDQLCKFAEGEIDFPE